MQRSGLAKRRYGQIGYFVEQFWNSFWINTIYNWGYV